MASAIDQAKEILGNSMKRFYWINERLKQIAEELKEIQPNKPKSITMSLNGCGKDCLGCPHVTWLSWQSGNNPKLKDKYIARRIKNPLLSADSQRDGFEHCKDKVKELIAEALRIEKERSSMIKQLSALRMIVYVNGEFQVDR